MIQLLIVIKVLIQASVLKTEVATQFQAINMAQESTLLYQYQLWSLDEYNQVN